VVTVDVVYDAIVLAGGSARRLGGVAKPQLDVAGSTLLDRVVDAVRSAEVVVVAGPHQPVTGSVCWSQEQPPGGGPVAALAAALPLTTAPVVVVLAGDLPWIAPAVPALLAAVPPGGLALLVDRSGRLNHLAAAWSREALTRALDRVGEPRGAAVRSLLAGADPVLVADPAGWGADCDTWDDVRSARARGGKA
jgi:molybdopterin-guanine dinucleotide biosynthesis protein A